MTNEEKFFARAAKGADVILMTAAFAALVLFSYVFYHYAWIGQRRIVTWTGGVLYYGTPLCVFLVSIAALRLKALLKIQLLMVFASLAAFLYGSEVFLRYLRASLLGSDAPIWYIAEGTSEEKKREAKELARSFGVDFDTRSRLEVVSDLEKQGIAAVPAVTPEMLRVEDRGSIESAIKKGDEEVLPLGGVSNRVTVLCNESGRYVNYASDEHGFSNPRGTWSSSRLEIVAVGDSFAHGFCVSPDNTFLGVIRNRYPALLNLGMAGNGPLLELAALQEYAGAFRPNVVLWFYFENDLSELQKERRTPLLLRYLEGEFRQGLADSQEDIDQALLGFIEHERRSQTARRIPRAAPAGFDLDRRLLNFVKLTQLRQRVGLVYGRMPEHEAILADLHGPTMNTFREILLQSKSLTERWGGTLYFIYLPGWGRYVNRTGVLEEKRDEVLAIVRDLKIPVIDIHEVFQSHSDPLSLFPFRASGHYNERGHRLVAEELLRKIPNISSDPSTTN
jgi:hypothetical protein